MVYFVEIKYFCFHAWILYSIKDDPEYPGPVNGDLCEKIVLPKWDFTAT